MTSRKGALMIIWTVGIISFLIGLAGGYGLKPSKIVRTEFKTIEKEVSVCDKASSNYEKAVCFAKEACRGTNGLDTFTYDGWKDKTDFSCKNFDWQNYLENKEEK